MNPDTALSKARRLQRICYFLYHHSEGLTAAEMARLCGVSQRTIQRDLRELNEGGEVPIWDDEGHPPRYGITEGYYVPPVRLSLDDALALYLAARLLGRYADSYNPHTTEALAKLAGILPEPIGRHIHLTVRALAHRQANEPLIRVLEALTLAWATGRVVRLAYRSAGSENVHEYLFRPYCIELSPVGCATHVIGWASYFDAVRTFKVERILSAELTNEGYEIPEGFDPTVLLESAWGIMFGEEREEVALRFTPSAVRRVKETHWHPSQELEDLPDGGCLLRLRVANPREMLYWIRGWGPQVEVLAPDWLRMQVRRDALEVVRRYEGGGR